MADTNRLELVLEAVDNTEGATSKARANMRSFLEEAVKAAQGATNSFDKAAIELARSIDRGARSATSSLDALERKAALAGKSGVDKLVAQRQVLIDRAGSDEREIQRIVAAYDKFISAQQRLDNASATKAAGSRAGQAVLAGEAEFQSALRKMQENNAAIVKLQADRQRALESPTQRVGRERAEYLSRFGGSAPQRSAIEQEFALRGQSARDQEIRAAGLAAGKAVLPGEAEFQAALKRVQSRDAEIRDIEDRARKASLSKPDYYRYEMESLLSRAGTTEAAAKRIRAGYTDIIKAAEEEEKSGHGAGNQTLRRGILGVKDFFEGSTRGAIIEGTDILVGTSGGGGILQKVIPQIAEITGLSSTAVIAVGGLTAAFLGLSFAGLESAKHLAETGEQIKNYSLRTGIAPTRVQAFQFAAKASGVDPDIFERMTRGLAQATNDDSPSGNKARKELQSLGVNLHDELGDLKPTEQIIIELAQAINKLPPGLQQSAASMEIFKRIGVEAVPVLRDLLPNLKKSDEIGGTFTEADLKMFEEWHKQMTLMGEEWQRFKAEIMKPLAVAVTATLHVVNEAVSGDEKSARAYGSPYASVLEPGVNNALAAQGYFADPNIPRPKPPGVPAGLSPYDVALQKRQDIDASIRAMNAEREKDPRFKLQEAEKALAALPVPELGVTKDPNVVDNYRQALKRVEELRKKSSSSVDNKGLEDVIAARKEGLDLDKKYAGIQSSAEKNLLSASLDSRKELTSTDDIDKRLQLGRLEAEAASRDAIESRRKVVDTKTGKEIDLSGTPDFEKFKAIEESQNLPKRIRNEYALVLSQIAVDDEKYFKARTDADGKAWEAAWQRRRKGELDLQDEEIRTRQQIQTHQFDIDGQAIDRQKEMALQNLGLVDAQTLKDKVALEDQKLAIEETYAERSLANQIAKLQNQETVAVAEIQRKAAESGNTGSDAEAADIASKRAEYQQQIDAARASTSDKEIIDSQKTTNAKEKLQIESNRKVYDSLKQDAAGLFDQLVFHTKSWGDFAKDMFKATILTPVKDIFSSQVAGLFTGLLTGQKVSFGEVGNGEGAFGKLGSIFGRAGLGQPRFGDANHPLAKLNAPNHLGDVSLVSGAVPVVMMNAAPHQQTVTNHLSFSSAAAGAGIASLFLGGASSGIGAVRSTPTFAADSTLITDPSQFGGPGASTGTFGSFSDISKLVGGPGGTSGFAGPVSGYGSSSSSSGGLLSSLGHSLIGGIGKLFGRGDGSPGSDSGETDAETGLPLGHDIPGSPDNSSGETSSGIGGPMGGLLMAVGSGLVMDSLRRKPGVTSAVEGPLGGAMIGAKYGGVGGAVVGAGAGLFMDAMHRGGKMGILEAAGGGAMIGAKFGGPVGALIGAGVGAVAGLVRSFFESDRDHTKKLVKQVYGMDINNATADQIIAIAKQGYGGQIDVAIRSQQVRDLLKLYAQTTGQKGAEDKFVQDTVHSASFVESGGRLYQQAVYDNGNAYAYSSPLATYGGVNTSPLQTYAPNNGVFSGNLQINLNGQSANDALSGQVVRVVTPGFVQGQALSASGSSVGRTSQQNMTLSPSALTR